jgi:hypothetical protein
MRLVRLQHEGRARHGFIDGDSVVLADGEPSGVLRTTSASISVDQAHLLPPVAPTTV